MLNKMATEMAQFFYANNGAPYDEDDVEVYAYGLEIFISTVLEALAVLLISIMAGRILETIAFFAAFIPIRSHAGGYHAKTHLRCFLGLLMVYSAFLLLLHTAPVWMFRNILIVFTFISAFPILLYAPLPDKNKPVGSMQRKRHRKISLNLYLFQAVIIVGLSVTGIVPYIALGFTIGQISASGSIAAAKVRDYCKGGEIDER